MRPVVFLLCMGWLFFSQCLGPEKRKFTDATSAQGFELAQQYCQSCHLVPQATDLDKATWVNYVLPKMGLFLGYHSMGMNRYITKTAKPLLSVEDWDKIRHHFITEAPDQLSDTSNRKSIKTGLDGFEVLGGSQLTEQPLTTYIGYQETKGQLLVGDGMQPALFVTDPTGTSKPATFSTGVGISHVITDTSLYVLTMGVLQPSDSRLGALVKFNALTGTGQTMLDSLQRPVHFVLEDLNQDGRKDFVVAEFGNQSGQLAWYEQTQQQTILKHTLRAQPGAIRVITTDWNKDGHPDIVVLMAQWDEGVFLYENTGTGQFKEKVLLRFPAVHGSNYLEMLDYNQDGLPDLLVTNGDNGDYPPVMKPYHGIRIFQNLGNNKFEQVLFLPMNGVGKAMAADFNQDGQLDIAAISFFPDRVKSPGEAFVLWKGLGQGDFEPTSFPEAKNGNWLTMDRADMDGDGDLDIVIGQASFGLNESGSGTASSMKSSWILLKNRLR